MKKFLGKNWFLLAIVSVVAFSFILPQVGIGIRRSGATRYLVAFVMFLSGLSLETTSLLREIRNIKAIAASFALVYIISPLLFFAMGKAAFPGEGQILVGIMIMAAQSSTLISGIVLTGVAGGNIALALVITVVNNFLSAVMTPLILRVSLRLGSAIEMDTVGMMSDMALTILAPVLAGQIARPLVRRWAAKMRPYLSKLSQFVILTFILTAISSASERISQSATTVLALSAFVLVAHSAMLLIAYSAAGALSQDRRSRIALMYCSSQKTLPAGILIWGTYFPQNPFGAIPITLYHVAQLFVDTFLTTKVRAEGAQVYSLVKDGRELSYVPPWPSPLAMLDRLRREFPDKEAIVHRDVDSSSRRALTFRELFEDVSRAADLFRSLNVKVGSKVAYGMANRPEAVIFDLALMVSGGIAVPLDIERDALERKIFKLRDSDAELLILADDYKDPARFEAEIEGIAKELPQIKILTLGGSKGMRYPDFERELMGCGADLAIREEVDPDSDAMVIYTSGTTGNPKGAIETVRSLFANADGIADWLKLTCEDRINLVLPLHHINSTVFALTLLSLGGTVILNSRYSSRNFWRIVAEERATCGSIVPTIMVDLLNLKDSFFREKYDISSLKKIMIGSAPVPAAVAERFVDTFGVRLIQGYGSTETNLRVTGVPVDLPEEEYREILKLNSIGVELKNCNVEILGAKGEGEEGEIVVRGPVVMKGYLNRPEETDEVFSGGWLHTGDMGFYRMILGRKYFFIKGRLKEIIIKGGVNISPVAVENAILSQFPALKEVYVVGVPDERMGEEILAVLVFRNDSPENERILQELKELSRRGGIGGLSEYESPRYFLVKREDDLPKTSTGKVQRTRIKEIVKEIYK
ncbi:MAG: AMP-binding protein [bacterium]